MSAPVPLHWVERVCNRVTPKLGGLLTVCQDDDGLLESVSVKAALAARGVTLHLWDGQLASAPHPGTVGEQDRPVLVVRGIPSPPHAVRALWSSSRSEVSIHAGDIWPRLDRAVTLAVPVEQREDLLAVTSGAAAPLNRRESALLVARSLYGVDSARLCNGGWGPTLMTLWLQGTVVPAVIAEEVVQVCAAQLPMSTTDALAALIGDATRVSALATCQSAGGLPLRTEAIDPFTRLLKPTVVSRAPPPVDIMERWESACASPAAAAAVMHVWAAAVADGTLPPASDILFQTAFEPWFVAIHRDLVHTPVRELLPIHEVVPRLDQEAGDLPMLLVVIDAMGLVPWYAALSAWKREGVPFDAATGIAIAAAPTITSVSRLSLMAGELQPAGFGKADKAKAERDAWSARFSERDPGGRCESISAKENWRQRISDRLAQGAARLAVVDVSWDHTMHGAHPEAASLADHAAMWALGDAATALCEVIEEALQSGYRVFVTADHGGTEAVGNGGVRTGDLVEEGSKRVQLFKAAASARAYSPAGTVWIPDTCPEDLTPLFAKPGECFAQKGARYFSHGGLTPQEVLVPVAELRLTR